MDGAACESRRSAMEHNDLLQQRHCLASSGGNGWVDENSKEDNGCS